MLVSKLTSLRNKWSKYNIFLNSDKYTNNINNKKTEQKFLLRFCFIEHIGNPITHGGPAEAFAFFDNIFTEASQVIIFI